MNEFLKKLNNFKFLSLIMLCLAGLGALIDVGTFLCYQFSGSTPVINTDRKGQLTNAFSDKPVVGMIFFLIILLALILQIIVIYKSYPYVKPKDKMVANKALPVIQLASGVLHLAALPFMFLMLAEHGRTFAGVIVCLILMVIHVAGNVLMVFPIIGKRIYMPEFVAEQK